MATSTVRTSISLPKKIWAKLKKRKNRSAIISDALELYFDREAFIDKAEKAYWKRVDESLKKGDGEYISINPNGEEITEELIREKLWG